MVLRSPPRNLDRPASAPAHQLQLQQHNRSSQAQLAHATPIQSTKKSSRTPPTSARSAPAKPQIDLQELRREYLEAMVVDPFSARALRARTRYMESFCNLDLAPDTAATATHSHCSGSCDAFNLLKHPWETSSAVALSSFAASTSAASKACATPRSCDNTLALATPSSALLSLSSSFLPAPPSPIAALASSSILPPPPPPRVVPSQSLLDTARRLPNDTAAYRVLRVPVVHAAQIQGDVSQDDFSAHLRKMNRVVADAHAAAFNRMMSHAEREEESTLSSHKALSDSTRAIAGSTERVRGRDGYAAFYSKTK